MQFQQASDQALLITLGGQIDLESHHRVVKLLRSLKEQWPLGVRNLHPAYNSILIRFDPCRTDHEELERDIRTRALDAIALPEPATVEIPVCYGGPMGPDLEDVAAIHSVSTEDVIALVAEALFTVYFLGFVPGFAYLGGLPAALATPRLTAPRKRVEAGSMGIAGDQAGVYPVPSPGGWRLLGRTPLKLFQPDRAHMSLLSIGDRVRFRPITLGEYVRLETVQA